MPSQTADRISVHAPEFVKRPLLKELESFVTAYESSRETWRTFCARCGTNLTFVCLEGRGSGVVPMLDVAFGTLDRDSLEEKGMRPQRHFYWDFGVGWVRDLVTGGDRVLKEGGVPRHPVCDRHVTC